MEYEFILRWLHVIGATVLLGTGAGIAFFMVMAHRTRDPAVIAHVASTVVIADWVFTTPAVIVQLATGLWLVHKLGIPWGSLWFIAVLALFILVGACWLPVI